MRRVAVLVLFLATLVCGCGGSKQPGAATNVETKPAGARAPAGFSLRVVKGQRFSIALPKDWTSLDAHEALNSGAMKRFRKVNPQLGGQMEALAQPNSPIKLLAIAPGPKGGFLTNLNVLVSHIPAAVPFETWSSAEVTDIQSVPTVKRLRHDETRLQPGRAVHVTYRAAFNRPSGPFVAVVHQYLVKKGAALYILTYTTQPRLELGLRKTFLESARTFWVSG
jgi:hypothetical protein